MERRCTVEEKEKVMHGGGKNVFVPPQNVPPYAVTSLQSTPQPHCHSPLHSLIPRIIVVIAGG